MALTKEQLERNKMEKKIKKMLIKEGDPEFVKQWLTKQYPTLGHKTPQEVINEGNGQKIIDILNQIFKDDEIARNHRDTKRMVREKPES